MERNGELIDTFKSVSNPFNPCAITHLIEHGLKGLDTDLKE